MTVRPNTRPIWVIFHTANTKWYDSYFPEGTINDLVEHMKDNPETFPSDDWFWIRIGEQFPGNLQDFVYYGNTGESPYEFQISLKEWEGSGSGTEWNTGDEFNNQLEPLPPYAFGTINYAYIPEWVEDYDLSNRVIPEDEIWNQI